MCVGVYAQVCVCAVCVFVHMLLCAYFCACCSRSFRLHACLCMGVYTLPLSLSLFSLSSLSLSRMFFAGEYQT